MWADVLEAPEGHWMNLRMVVTVALLPALLSAAGNGAGSTAPAPLAVGLGPGSWISLEGTSTLHPYTSRSTRFLVTATRRGDARDPSDATGLVELAGTSVVQGVTVDIPVRSLLSGEGGLDKNLWKTLKSEEYPRIEYRLSSYALASPSGTSDTLRVRAEGTLKVTGVERPVPLEVVAVRSEGGVVLEGTSTLRMTDFGVKPPRLMLGALRVGDRIVIRYHLLVVPGMSGVESPATAGREVGRP
jgi:polyisoprenoid-binding protein YceI